MNARSVNDGTGLFHGLPFLSKLDYHEKYRYLVNQVNSRLSAPDRIVNVSRTLTCSLFNCESAVEYEQTAHCK